MAFWAIYHNSSYKKEELMPNFYQFDGEKMIYQWMEVSRIGQTRMG